LQSIVKLLALRMKLKSLLSGLFLLCAIVCVAAIVDLSGKWTGTLNYGGTDYPMTYNFKVDGEKLTGTVEGPAGVVNIEDGVIKSNKFSFNSTLNSGDVIHETGIYYTDSTAVNLVINDAPYHVKLLRAK